MTTFAVALLFGSSVIGLVLALHLIRLRARFAVASFVLAGIFTMMAVSAALLALHLLHSLPVLLTVRALLALLIIPGFYLFFEIVLSEKSRLSWFHARYLVPSLTGVVVVASGLQWLLDGIILLTLVFYIIALTRFWRQGETVFSCLGDRARSMFLWLQTVLIFLSTIAIIDTLILLDLSSGGRLEHSYPLLFAAISLSTLSIFAIIGALGRPSLFESLYDNAVELTTKHSTPVEQVPDPSQIELAQTVKQALYDANIISDEALTLTRLARKLGIPARSLSQAINQVFQQSFSELLNDGRIALCQQIMQQQPEKALLDIMMEAGYASKSNFYKQFYKRVGMTPGAYLAAQTKSN